MLSDINSFWYRRGYLNLTNRYTTKNSEFSYLQSIEINKLLEFIYYQLNKLRHLNSFKSSIVNKLIVNDLARSLKITTPNDFIFSTKSSLSAVISSPNDQFITKVISGHCVQEFNSGTIYNYTNLVDINNLDSTSFFPSLVQNYVPKKYELRIFFLDNKFYTMAIFSQKDNQTNVDFRNYNDEKPNRTVPYKLPKEIENSLHLLMNKLDLNCGSIDMIVTPKNEYVFLEVNPVGQFGMVSYPCNYNLEKKIAEYL
jgi:ATP-GRASP peptide maturase of grasp-with-spasm system